MSMYVEHKKKSIHSPNFVLPTTFNLAICQTLTLPNIPAVYCYYRMEVCIKLLLLERRSDTS